MKKGIRIRFKADEHSRISDEYLKIISDLVNTPVVRSMEQFMHHSDLSCFFHSINVSYHSYIVCRFLGLDYIGAARGGLLHDLFLYDWHITKVEEGMHGFTHPHTALKNANAHFLLNDLEKDIIKKHMWPLTVKLPKYKESFIVCMVDKYCAVMEVAKLNNKQKLFQIIAALNE